MESINCYSEHGKHSIFMRSIDDQQMVANNFICISSANVRVTVPLLSPVPPNIVGTDPPILDLDTSVPNSTNATVTFLEEEGRVKLIGGSSHSLTDTDSTTLSQATLTLLNRPNEFNEYLELAQPTGIVVVIHQDFASGASSGTLSLFGSFSPEVFLQVLGEVYYVNTDPNPREAEVRKISIVVVDDTGATSEPAFIHLFVEPYNNAPLISLGGSGLANFTTTFTEGGPCVALTSSGVQIIDPDSVGITSASVSLQLSDYDGSDEFITFQGNIPATTYVLSPTELLLVLSNASFSAYEEILPHIVYCNNADEPESAPRAVSIVATDLGLLTYDGTSSLPPASSGPAYAIIDISQVNDPPSLHVEPAITAGGIAPTNILLQGSTVLTDIDSVLFSQIRITLSNAPDGADNETILIEQNFLSGGALVGPVVDGDMYTYTFTFSGLGASVANVSEVMDGILYQNTDPSINTTTERRICIEVSDSESFSNQACVNLTVSDSSENSFVPTFSEEQYNFTVFENAPSGVFLGQVLAFDDDTGISGQVLYTFGPDSPTQVIVDPWSGVLTASFPLDAEAYTNLILTVMAVDLGNPPNNASVTVVLEVLDINDNAPQFIFPAGYSITIPENAIANITMVKAIDADSTSPNNVIEYSLSGGPFNINSETGDIMSTVVLDRENQEKYTLIVTAVDGAIQSLASMAVITITVSDINDNPTLLYTPTQSYYLLQHEPLAQTILPSAELRDSDASISGIAEINITLSSTVGEERPYNACLGNCQDVRLAAAGLSNSTEIASEAQFFTAGNNVSDLEVPIGEGNCSAIRLTRGAAADGSEDVYGNIPSTSLPAGFGGGEYSVSFVANIRAAGYVFLVIDTDDPTTAPSRVNFELGLQVTRTGIVLEYVHGASRQPGTFQYSLSSNDPFEEFFSASVSTTRHYVLVIHSIPTPALDIYIDCKLLVSAPLVGAVQAPDLQFGLFLGQSLPTPVTSDGRLDADIHGLYYHPYALTDTQISEFCPCELEYLSIPTSLPTAITALVADGQNITLKPSNDLMSFPAVDAVQTLRQVKYVNSFFVPTTGQPTELAFTVTDVSGLITSYSTQIIFLSQEQSPQPLLDLNGPDSTGENITVTFTEGADPVALVSTNAELTWVGFDPMVSAFNEIVVEIVGVGDPDEALGGTPTDHITIAYTNATSLKLIGPGSASEFLEALQSLTYSNTNPRLSSITREVLFTVCDVFSGVNQPFVYANIAVEAVNQPPLIGNLPISIVYMEGSSVLVAPELSVSDSDSENISMALVTVSSPTTDALSVSTAQAGVNITFSQQTLLINGEATLSIYQSILQTVQYSSSDNPPVDEVGMPVPEITNRTIEITIADAEGSLTTAIIPITFHPLNDQPAVMISPASLYFNGSGQPAVLVAASPSISDPDSLTWKSMTVTLNYAVDGDYLTDGFRATRILIYGQTDSLENYEMILQNITYNNPQFIPTPVSRGVIVEVCDSQDCGSASVLILVDPLVCQPSTCLNAGTCIEGPALQSSCICEIRFTGDSCEIPIPVFVVEFKLDLDVGQLSLTFQLPVNASTLDASALTLQNNDLATSNVTLTGVQTITEGVVLQHNLTLFYSDLNAIKADESLATSIQNTYLSISEGAYLDSLGNPVLAIPDGSALPASEYTADDTSPVIVSFSLLEMPQENVRLVITFSETVQTSNLSISNLTLLTGPGSNTSYQLTGGTASIHNSPEIEIVLSLYDVATIRESFYPLGSSPDTTYLSATEFAITDTAGNYLISISNFSPLQADTVTADFVPPTINSFSLDMDAGMLAITFSEEISPSTLNLSSVTLHNAAGSQSLILTNNTVSTVATSSTVDIGLTDRDLDRLKIAPGFAAALNDTFLSALAGYVADVAGNTAREDIVSLQVTEIQLDMTQPHLETFVTDLNVGLMTLSFSEPVVESSVDIAQLVLTSARVNNGLVPTFSPSTTILSTLSTRTVLVFFSKEDRNEIKRREICLSQPMCNLHFPRTPGEVVAVDYAANILIEIPPTSTLQANSFIPDVTRPELELFQMDMDSGVLGLSFSETVALSSFDLTQITLQSSNSSEQTLESYTLTGGIPSNTSNADSVQVYTTTDDLNGIKTLTGLCTDSFDCHITFTQFLVFDVSGNIILDTSPVAVDTFVPDITRPILESFDLDLTDTTLTLHFDEVVVLASFHPYLITVLSYINSTQALTLTGGLVLTTGNDTVILFVLTEFDTKHLQANTELATGVNNTFLSFPSGIIEDTFRNPAQSAVAIPVTVYTQDSIAPRVVSVNLLDVNAGLLNFSLSEPISDSVDPTPITICSVANCSMTSYSLTSAMSIYVDPGTKTTAELELLTGDLIAIKSLFPNLASSRGNSFVAVGSGTFQDTAGNDNLPVPLTSAVQVVNYIDDTSPPTLSEFILDLNNGQLGLIFDDVIDAASLNVAGITLQSEAVREVTTSYLQLTGGTLLSDNGLMLVLQLTAEDYSAIISDLTLATSISNTFIAITEGTVSDVSGNVIPSVSGLQASMVILDNPLLLGFDFDINAGTLSLTFSEPVDPLTINTTGITLLNMPLGIHSYRLTGGMPLTAEASNHTVIEVSNDDLNSIKALPQLATARHNSYISIEAGTVADLGGNQVVPVPSFIALQATDVTDDTTRPEIVSFNLRSGSVVLVVNFTETINASSVDPPGFTVLQSPDSSNAVTLTGGDIRPENSPIIEITLTLADVESIQDSYPLGSSPQTTYLTVALTAAADMTGNYVSVPTTPLQVSALTADFVPPELLQFILDINSGAVMVVFTEHVLLSSLNVSKFLLQEAPSDPINVVDLTGSEVVTVGGGNSQVEIQMTESLLDSIKLSHIGASNNSAYISVLLGAVTDGQGNSIQHTILQATQVFLDTVPPSLVSFNFNMDGGRMVLSFSEPILLSSLMLTDLILARAVNTTAPAFAPSTSNASEMNVRQVLIEFSSSDLNELKLLDICIERSTCYLSLSPLSNIADLSNQTILPASALPVQNHTSDVTPPQLSSFASFDLDSGTLELSFTETVNILSFSPTELILQNSPGATFSSSYILTGGELSYNTVSVTVTLSHTDLNAVKADGLLCTSESTCYAQFSAELVDDVSGNSVVPTLQAQALDYLEFDSTQPRLLTFDLDLNTGLMTLYFDETVNSVSFAPEEIVIQNSPSATAFVQLSPDTSFDGSIRSNTFGFTVDSTDIINLQTLLTLATGEDDTFLSFSANMILDTSGNRVQPSLDTDPLSVGIYTADMIQPRLLDFSVLDMDEGEIELAFSEPVLASAVELSSISLCSTPNCSTFATLSSSSGVTSTQLAGVVQQITLSFQDLCSIKRLYPSLASSPETAWISLDYGSFVDTASNPVLQDLLNVNRYQLDSTRPDLIEFQLDVNEGRLVLEFNDVIDSSSAMANLLRIQRSGGPSEFLQLTSATQPSIEQPLLDNVLELVVGGTDLSNIRLKAPNLATSTENTFLSFTIADNAFLDVFGNELNSIHQTNALQASSVIPFELECQNEGTFTPGSLECECVEGFNGTLCENDMDFCQDRNPCQNGGTCVEGVGALVSCSCPKDFAGVTCEFRTGKSANQKPTPVPVPHQCPIPHHQEWSCVLQSWMYHCTQEVYLPTHGMRQKQV